MAEEIVELTRGVDKKGNEIEFNVFYLYSLVGETVDVNGNPVTLTPTTGQDFPPEIKALELIKPAEIAALDSGLAFWLRDKVDRKPGEPDVDVLTRARNRYRALGLRFIAAARKRYAHMGNRHDATV
jgi:hypothetical protein